MAVKIDEPPDATPLDPDEAQGLVPSHIATREQLNEWEQQNIVEGERWAFGRKIRQAARRILTGISAFAQSPTR